MNSGHKNIAGKILVDGKRNWRRRNVSGTQKRLEGKILVECKRGWSRPPAPKPGGDPNRALGCRPGSVPCTGGRSHGCWPPWGCNHTPPLPRTAPMAPHPTHKKNKRNFFYKNICIMLIYNVLSLSLQPTTTKPVAHLKPLAHNHLTADINHKGLQI